MTSGSTGAVINDVIQGDCYAIPKILATFESIEAVVIDDVVGAGPPVERVVDVGEQDVEEEARNSKLGYFAPQLCSAKRSYFWTL